MSFLQKYAWLSIAAACCTIVLKGSAYVLTGSVGLFSDAVESLVNLVAAVATLISLGIAARPPDEDHSYGHFKAEYFSSGLEGGLIIFAALSICYAAVSRLFEPQPLEQLGLGLAVSLLASLINLGVALVLRRAGKRYDSIALEADSEHLLTDVWTSAGVLLGVGLMALTGWSIVDPLIALLVAANIIWTGGQLIRRSMLGLLDTELPPAERATICAVLEPYTEAGVQYHALRSRRSGSHRFVSLHVLVPGRWSVQRGHQLLEEIERDIRGSLPSVTVFTHLEPLEDPTSFHDTQLMRADQEEK
jgi:cation diffusion facilitator family transporter